MEFRKNSASNLEDKKGVFLLIGLLLILSVTYAAFNIKSFTKAQYDFEMTVEDDLAELPPVTTPPPPPPPPPPPIAPPTIPEIEIVEDDIVTEEPDFNDDNLEDIEIDEIPSGDGEAIDDVPTTFVSNMPYFGDCGKIKNNIKKSQCTLGLIQQFIRDNYELPDIAREMGYEGTVLLQFTVNRKGKVVNANILRGVAGSVDKEALRVINSLPQFVPGKNLDKPASVLYSVPIKITLD